MSGRKPSSMSFREWVDAQVSAAERDQQFQKLPGFGKPIPDSALDPSDNAMLAAMLRRHDVDVSFALPPALALAKEVEVLAQRLDDESDEAAVRKRTEDLNDRIRAAHRAPNDGPPMRVMPVDVEAQVHAWRSRAAERAVRTATAAPTESAPPSRHRRFSLRHRRGR